MEGHHAGYGRRSELIASSSKCAAKLLKDRPCSSANAWIRWCRCQDSVTDARCGVRRISSAADALDAGWGLELENEDIALWKQGDHGAGR